MKKTENELEHGHTCWECLLRLLKKQDPMSLGRALSLTHLAQKDSRYRPGWSRRNRRR
jgi:hypothetical protein